MDAESTQYCDCNRTTTHNPLYQRNRARGHARREKKYGDDYTSAKSNNLHIGAMRRDVIYIIYTCNDMDVQSSKRVVMVVVVEVVVLLLTLLYDYYY